MLPSARAQPCLSASAAAASSCPCPSAGATVRLPSAACETKCGRNLRMVDGDSRAKMNAAAGAQSTCCSSISSAGLVALSKTAKVGFPHGVAAAVCRAWQNGLTVCFLVRGGADHGETGKHGRGRRRGRRVRRGIVGMLPLRRRADQQRQLPVALKEQSDSVRCQHEQRSDAKTKDAKTKYVRF